MWKIMPEQQQRGAQIERRKRGAAPEEAVADRSAQDHDYADLDLSPDGQPREDIDYPADSIPDREGDITPTAPDPHVEWDTIVQPERTERGSGDGHEDIERGA